jgi:LysR family glycine cleavage system transcriptional activator
MTGNETLMPPFPALRAFHAAARLGRFKDAARDLGVTESAISHQVRRLEDFLQVRLFERQGPRVFLTPTAVRYFEEIDPAMARIAQATRALMGPRERARVAVTLPPSLAILWLIPNLAAFEAACPEIDLELVTTTRVIDLRREQIDIAIRHGRGPWPNTEAEFLLTETAIPVCRPGYLDAAEAPQGEMAGDATEGAKTQDTAAEGGAMELVVAALSGARVIVNGAFPDEWLEWAGAHGIAGPALEAVLARALRLESQEQVLAAAEGGLGIAMGRRPLVDESLRTGALLAPFGMPDHSQAGYFLCRAPGSTPSIGARRVWRWLHDFAARQGAPVEQE